MEKLGAFLFGIGVGLILGELLGNAEYRGWVDKLPVKGDSN